MIDLCNSKKLSKNYIEFSAVNPLSISFSGSLLCHLPIVFFSIWTRPLVFSRVCPRGSRHLVSISFCTVWQKMMKESFTKCVIDGVDGCRRSEGAGGLSGGGLPLPLMLLSSCPRIAAAINGKGPFALNLSLFERVEVSWQSADYS